MSRFFRGLRNPAALAFGPAVSAQYGADADAGEVDDPTTIAAAWNSGTAYYPGMQVTSGGNYYYCLASNRATAVTDTAYWSQITNVIYFSGSAGDDATGVISATPATAKASPYGTLNKASDFVYKTGTPDAVNAPRGTLLLFNRGQTFTGNLYVQGNDGTPHAEYILGAYGSGARPVFQFNDSSPQTGLVAVIQPIGAGVTTGRGGIVRNIVADAKNTMIYAITQTGGSAFVAGDVITLAAGGKQSTIQNVRTVGGLLQLSCIHSVLLEHYSSADTIQTAGGAKTGTIYSGAVTQTRGISADRSNWQVWNCEIKNTIGNAVAFGYAGDETRGNNIVFYNISVHDSCVGATAGAGMQGGPGTGCKLLHSTIYDCGNLTNQTFVHNLYWAGLTNCELAYNKSYMTDGSHGSFGMVVHGNNTDLSIHHNLIDSCVNGIGCTDGYHWTEAEGFTRLNIYSNKIVHTGTLGGSGSPGLGLHLSCLVDSKVYNNIVADSAYNISISDRTAGAGAFPPLTLSNVEFSHNTITTNSANAIYAISVTGALLTNIRFKDNIVVTKNANVNAVAFRRDSTAPTGEVHLSNNLMWNTTSGSFPVVNWGGTTYTVAGFAGATSEGANSVQAAPSFTNEGAGDYSLASSPAFHTGTPISGITTDFAGTARNNSTPSMGAYEGTS